jgi:dipeptidyl aminopeptidase/acylaminoacyl peptidase
VGLDTFKIQAHQGLEILSMDHQEKRWTVRVFDDRGAYYFLFDQANGEIVALGENRFDPQNRWTAAVKPVQLKSRDGLTLHGYLTRPRGGCKAPAPMVLLVHGGPWSRDYWEYDEMVQFLANRGYTVLQINFRGSEGYGRRFKEAAIGEFSGKMHTDLVDAVNWAVAHGIADPSAIAIVGGSYGGYAALVGLTDTPELFACGVAINGVADVGRFVKDLPSNPPPTLRAGISAWHTYVTRPDADQAQKVFERISPLYHAEKLTKPVLVVFGERDSRVPPEHSEMMIKELNRLHKPVQSLQFMNEGHGITRLDNTCEMFQTIEAFLARHLGGRSAGGDKKADGT